MNLRERAFQLKVRLAKPGALDMQRRLDRAQYCSSDELADENWKKSIRMLRFAYDHSPFYRQKYQQSGMFPQDVKEPGDWLKVPSITKEEIRENFSALRVTGTTNKVCIGISTGGSTGMLHLKEGFCPVEVNGVGKPA